MRNNIFIPKQINVGFQERSDTYTKKLAYIIYYDAKGVLRKEKSWESWRDNKIDNIIYDNVPTSGFVLNKKVGDYCSDWNHRQAYVRVYDSRDFEFEITIENLLYILENASSIKGKGLEGEFIFGWDKKDLLLMPIDSPDYKEISEFNKILHEKKTIKSKELILGATYKTKQNEEWIYMGKFDYHGWRSNNSKQFWFYDITNKERGSFTQIKALGDKLIQVIDEKCCDNYAKLFDELECKTEYSPIDSAKDEYEYYDLEYFTKTIKEKILDRDYYWSELKVYYNLENDLKTIVTIRRKDKECNNIILKATRKLIKMEKRKNPYWNHIQEYEREVEYDEIIIESENLEEIFNKLQPQYKNIYLQNGKLRGGNKNNE